MTENKTYTADVKTKTIVLGALIGALTGAGAAYVLLQNAEKEGKDLNLTAGKGMKLGMLLLGTLRQIAQMDD